ncbi:MAG: thioredoxin family protein [Longimicrobiales bacterium]
MTTGLEEYWDKAVTFDRWLDQVEANRDLWRGIYDRAAVEPGVVDRVDGPFRLLVLAEDWCGDAVNTIPWLARLAEASHALELRILRRDENPALMASHTTGGSSSIPVVMVLDRAFHELGWWGPRPEELQAWVLEEGLALTKQERYMHVRAWYARDRGRTTLAEVLALIEREAAR